MTVMDLLFADLTSSCPDIHLSRLRAVFDVAGALERSQNLSLSEMGRNLLGDCQKKHKIKKVDRLEGNQKLHGELGDLYAGLSSYVIQYLNHNASVPIAIDLCFVKDDRKIQMLSAEVTLKGRTLPLYRDVFKEGEFKDKAQLFIKHLKRCLPQDKDVILIMDAGFYATWRQAIEAAGWYWVNRIRKGQSIRFSDSEDWTSASDFMPKVKERTTHYSEVQITKRHRHTCRLVTTRRASKGRFQKTKRGSPMGPIASGSYQTGAKEPWLLATNLPASYKASEIVKFYTKRMQIEESFRDVKSHQFGLSGRYIRTTCINRWGVKMLLAAIVQITYWVLGVIGHSQGMQAQFQSNTIRHRKVFSYFTLGRLMIEHGCIKNIRFSSQLIFDIIKQELQREW